MKHKKQDTVWATNTMLLHVVQPFFSEIPSLFFVDSLYEFALRCLLLMLSEEL